MKIRPMLFPIVILTLILSACSSFSNTPIETATLTLAPTITNTLEPTITPTPVYTTTPITSPTLSAVEISACPQILYDALAESSARYQVKFPGYNTWNGESLGGIYYAISLANVKTFTVGDNKIDAVELASVFLNSETGKPTIRTNWQMLGRDMSFRAAHPYDAISLFAGYDCNNQYYTASCPMDNFDSLVEQGVIEYTEENMMYSDYLTRDEIIEMYTSDYYFVSNEAADIANSKSLYGINPFRVIFANVGDVNNPATIKVNPDYVAYELENDKPINKWLSYEPYPEDWVNTFFDMYREESIDALQTVSVEKVRTCLNSLK